MTNSIEKAYQAAQDVYAQYGIDPAAALTQLEKIAISIHCWQGDDVGGFETPDSELAGGGIQVTGNYPGKATSHQQLRTDLEKAASLIPGHHRLNLHAIYGEFQGKKIDRDQIEPAHYQGWIDWAKAQNFKLDFNATCFSHPKADDGLTLSSPNPAIRDFWIEHVSRARKIAAEMGKQLNSPAVHNLWIPDGTKDVPVDRMGLRQFLKQSLDTIYQTRHDKGHMKDAVESKLFGIGSESFVVGSHEFYMGYALKNDLMVCLDTGHFHPTELVADKLSSTLLFCDEVLLHVSRPVRWDSDHVVIMSDEIKILAEEIIRSNRLDDIHIGLDFFDASINRIGAWVVGTQAMLKCLLLAFLQPYKQLLEAERNNDGFTRLALQEQGRTLPFGSVWDYYCHKNNIPTGPELITEIKNYENQVLSKR